MAQTATVRIDSEDIFTDAFSGEMVGTSGGQWRFDSGGSSASSRTGPGTNNTDAFMHTETSNISGQGLAESNGIADFVLVPDGINRMLNVRLCIQGDFGDGIEGLDIQHRPGSGPWIDAVHIPGWDYSNTYVEADDITNEDGTVLVCVADGGWIDFQIPIPDSATQVRLQPRYIFGGGDTWRHDVALRSFYWTYDDPQAQDVAISFSGRAGSPTADFAFDSQLVQVAISFSGRAGSPTASFSFRAALVQTPRRSLQVQWILDLGTNYFWSGSDDLAFEGRTYQGRGKLVNVGGPSADAAEGRGLDAGATSISIRVTDPALRETLLQQDVPVQARVGWIYSDDKGLSWNRAPFFYVGYLSGPIVVDGVYTATITEFSKAKRNVITWSAEGQRERFPDDPGMDGMRQIGQGIEIGWPP